MESSSNVLLSIVSPVYRGEKMVNELVRRICESVNKITEEYEIILVNDYSPDKSWNAILEACRKDKRVKGINLSRNFGQHYAITAGLSYAKGKWVVVMDCDLQDRPEEIPNLYNKALEGYDIVYAQRKVRQDKFLKRMSSKIFHSVYDYLSGLKTDNSIANFGIYSYKVIREFNRMKERSRSFPSLVSYLGFKNTCIEVQHAERYEGKSSYSFKKLCTLAFNVIIANSNKPLRLAVFWGFIISFVSLLLAFYNVLAYYLDLILVPGFTTIVFSIWFVGGCLMAQIGILGLYIGKIFDQVKGRQLFIIDEEVNIEK